MRIGNLDADGTATRDRRDDADALRTHSKGEVVGQVRELAHFYAWRRFDFVLGHDRASGASNQLAVRAAEVLHYRVAADGICGVYHHVAAYDLIGAAILLGVLFLVYRKWKLRYGQLFWIWAAWYGIQRFVLDALRVGSGDAQVGSLTWNQLSGFLLGAGAIAILFWFDKRQKPVTQEEDQRLIRQTAPAKPPASRPE